MITLWLVLGMLASIAIHEGAHILVAKQLGWQVVGMGLNTKVVGVKVKTESKEIAMSAWMVAIAGPMSNVAFGDVLWTFDSPVARVLAYFNFIVACINLLPIPGSDGTVILKSLRDQLES